MATAPKTNAGNKAADRQVLLRVEGLTKVYDGAVKAVDDVSFTVMKGDIFGLLGGSGCGKSTLLRMLAGFETPTKGKIFLEDQDITKDRKSTRLNSSHRNTSRMPSSA